VQTPRFCGQACMAGTLFRFTGLRRGLRIICCIVGILPSPCFHSTASKAHNI
jgi:hypothetical protein